MDKKFLLTNNPETASILTKLGFELINENGDKWTFLNNKKITFQKLDDLVFTNIMTF